MLWSNFKDEVNCTFCGLLVYVENDAIFDLFLTCIIGFYFLFIFYFVEVELFMRALFTECVEIFCFV